LKEETMAGNVIKVLIVDDIPETREMLRKILAFESDIEVVGAAETGREGLEYAREYRPDIVWIWMGSLPLRKSNASCHVWASS
jgi:DNA-binding NarL/FixJ family response regulator